MKFLRSTPVLLTAAIGAFMVVPIVVAANISNRTLPVTLPTFHSQTDGQSVQLTPISTRKAQAVRDFKLAQI